MAKHEHNQDEHKQERREKAYRYYSLDTQRIQQLLARLFVDDRLPLPTKTEERARVLEIFFKDGRLLSIPTQRTKRRYILEELARSFEWGHLYNEQEIHVILKQFHDDTATLRRELIDQQIMMRERGCYRSCGRTSGAIGQDSCKRHSIGTNLRKMGECP